MSSVILIQLQKLLHRKIAALISRSSIKSFDCILAVGSSRLVWAQLVFNIIVGIIAVAGLILATLEYTSDDKGI